jgi:type II secretory pathway pseudopilin PulG
VTRRPFIQSRGRKGALAFTLLEVILAVVIVTGLLSIALYFYQQAARLRGDLLVEVDRITAARLLMDRITTELRCARRHSYFEVPLLGASSSLQFITTGLPTHAAWSGEAYGRVSRPEVDLKYITYSVAAAEDGTNVAGLFRREEPLVAFRTPPTETMAASESTTNSFAPLLVTDQLHALRFRYWNGTAWQDDWSDTRLPAAVEITLGVDALSQVFEASDVESEPEPDRIFRRVVYLPGSTAPAPRGTRSSEPALDPLMEGSL